ncbi:phosphatase PAP2 family protein [Duncaniella sp.]|uniref:phosphatase PAP2 family protein n=1 Tax=Duncaniella sp. TaxID=2518496 RepID=UPI0023CD0CB3|nr:phosphatase PAP2 family protein [Duncaniella sp.]MDE5905108.1 phosphatase PAP2 family protein [Duncaniella sp.]
MKKIGLIVISVWLAVCNAAAADRGSRLVSKAADTEVDCLQYLPMVFPEAMKLCGQPTRSGWGRLVVSQGFSVVLMAGTVYSLKHIVGERRPDRSDCRSFPSGHSAWAFAGATVVARELGWRSAWYPVGAYAFAAGIAIERIAVRRHSALDVAAGALTGVAMTELGYFLADRIYGGRGLSDKYRLSVSPAALAVPAGCAGQDAFAVAPGVIFSLEF